jgi:hypothetical protein
MLQRGVGGVPDEGSLLPSFPQSIWSNGFHGSAIKVHFYSMATADHAEVQEVVA